jgi:hypothetical protein
VSRAALRLSAIVLGVGLASVAPRAFGWFDAAELTGVEAPAAPPAQPLSIHLRRVRFDLTPGGASITHELVFPKKGLASLVPGGTGDALVFVAFTAQARPLAFEAVRLPLGADGRPIDAAAQPLKVDHVVVRPSGAPALLGNARAAGHVLHLQRGDDGFVLRLRAAVAVEPGHKTVNLLARLGARERGYLPLDRVEVSASLGTKLRGGRATLCGAGSSPTPILLHFIGYPDPVADAAVIDPSFLSRHADDDLCLEAQID